MTIKYKFNKSSESRDCVVKSVELKIVKFVSQKRILNIQDLKSLEWEVLHCFNKKEEQEVKILLKCNEIDYKQGWTDKENLEECFFVFNDCLPTYHDIIKVREIFRLNKETKQFTSPQQLKDYINTIQESIEFIAESSIDDVLMKEWIGDWETELRKNDIFYPVKLIVNSNWTFKIK